MFRKLHTQLLTDSLRESHRVVSAARTLKMNCKGDKSRSLSKSQDPAYFAGLQCFPGSQLRGGRASAGGQASALCRWIRHQPSASGALQRPRGRSAPAQVRKHACYTGAATQLSPWQTLAITCQICLSSVSVLFFIF